MRLHARPDHPDYRPDCGDFDVRFNGIMVEKCSCIFADEEAGIIEFVVRDVGGTPLQFAGQMLTETKRGKVEIIPRHHIHPSVTDDTGNNRSAPTEFKTGAP